MKRIVAVVAAVALVLASPAAAAVSGSEPVEAPTLPIPAPDGSRPATAGHEYAGCHWEGDGDDSLQDDAAEQVQALRREQFVACVVELWAAQESLKLQATIATRLGEQTALLQQIEQRLEAIERQQGDAAAGTEEEPVAVRVAESDRVLEPGLRANQQALWWVAGFASVMLFAYGFYRQVMPRA